MAIPAEYQQMLDEYNKQYDLQRRLADKSALGEAQRRGLVGQTGTSTIESLMRQRAVTPIEQARSAAVADLMARGASEQLASNEAEKARQWQTGERLGGQEYGTSERLGSQAYGTGEREAAQRYGTGERTGSQDWQRALAEYQAQQNAALQKSGQEYDKESLMMQRGWQGSDIKKQRQDWWKDATGSLLGGLGSGIGSLFCFDPETYIDMADGSKKQIKNIDVGDETLGGEVLSKRVARVFDGEVYNYLGVLVTGTHAVKEAGVWKRVGQSDFGIPMMGDRIVHSIVTSKHRVYANGLTFTDETEHDDSTISPDKSLELLNEQEMQKEQS